MGGPESTGGLWDIDFADEMRSVNLTVHPAPGEESTTISRPPELALNLAETLQARALFLMNHGEQLPSLPPRSVDRAQRSTPEESDLDSGGSMIGATFIPDDVLTMEGRDAMGLIKALDLVPSLVRESDGSPIDPQSPTATWLVVRTEPEVEVPLPPGTAVLVFVAPERSGND